MSDRERVERTAAFWSVGDYPRVAERLLPVARDLVAHCAPGPGDRVLDVAAGTGNATLAAAERGAHVTASDITPAMIALGRARTAAEGLEDRVEWHEADAQALPFADGVFDLTMSVFGAIFAPDPERTAAELARVTRAGGVLALAAWALDGVNGRLGKIARRHMQAHAPSAGPEPPDPALWGDPEVAVARLAPHCDGVETATHTLRWEFASPGAALAFYVETAPPFVMARQAVGDAYPAMRAELADLIAEAAEPAGEGIALVNQWLLIRGRPRPG